MKNFDDFISVLNTIVTIISLFSPLLLKWFKHTHKSRWLYTFLFVIICFSILGSFYLLIDSSDRIERLIWGILFVVCIGVLIWYAHNAIKSLDGEQENILPPKMFWQMLLNKVPSEISNDGNNNLKNIFAVVSMDKSSEVSNAKEKIKSSYNENEDYSIKYVNGYEKENEGVVFSNLNEKLSDVSIRGVLFLVGPNASKMKGLKDCISVYASSHKVNPIACYWSQNNGYNLPYYKIQFEKLDDFVKLLATRGYYRNNLQIQLGHAYRKTFIVQGILLFLFFLGLICFRPKFIKMQDENTCQKQNICDLRDSVAFYLRPGQLNNNIFSKGEINLEAFDIELFKNDKEIVSALIQFSNYYFEDIENFRQVKLWYKNSCNGLICILDTKNNNNDYLDTISIDGYMMGAVVEHKLFVLWPGEGNIQNKKYGPETKIVWYFDGDDDKQNPEPSKEVKGEIKQDNNNHLYWEGFIDNKQPLTIPWHSDSHDDKSFAMFGFSFDGLLAVEVEIDPFTQKDYKYMSHLMFRNSVRKYMKIVSYILANPKYKRKE